jgi:hypothetical protein
MKEYWIFLVSALQDVLGKQLGLLAAWIFLLVVILLFLVPLSMMMRRSTELRSQAEDEMAAISGAGGAVERKPRFGLSLNPFFKIGRGLSIGQPHIKVSMGEPVIIKLDNAAIQKARDSLSAGGDLDSICRELEPEYATWISIRQQAFQKAMEALLKAK